METKWPDIFHEDIEGWFKEGCRAADNDEKLTANPYLKNNSLGSPVKQHWWTRGYSYQFRLYRAIKAEKAILKGTQS